VVRQRSAKPPFSGSNPDAASTPIIETGPSRPVFYFPPMLYKKDGDQVNAISGIL
jgi:hypothetical protein